MSFLLPIFVSPQNGSHVIGNGGATAGSLNPVTKDQPTISDQASPQAFSQVFREYNEPSLLGKHLQTVGSTVGFEETENILGEVQSSEVQASPEGFVSSITEPSLSLSSAVIVSFEGFQTSAREFFQSSGFQNTGGDIAQGPSRQESEIGGRILGITQIPLPKALEAGSLLSHDPVAEEASSVHTVVSLAKNASSGLQKVEPPVLGNETLQTPILSKISSSLTRPQGVQSNHIPPATAIQVEGPAGNTGPNLANQILVKSTHGNSSLLSEGFSHGVENRTTAPPELLGGAEVLAKGERDQTLIESSVKTGGLDPSGGQGLGNGMNHSSNSQSGSQQQSSFPGQGLSLRALEGRGQEFPGPSLQRLQMDVQLSENQRVHVDVGVHNRQVYTGLVMDHSILRNLATQFVPQLENQLAEVDLELQEFSAEVREEREQEEGRLFDDSRFHKAQESGGGAQGELLSTQNLVSGQEEPGLHYVA